jgi:anti-sigma factor RsiW
MTIRDDQHIEEWVELAVDYLDGRCDQDTKTAIERHLAGCPECATRLARQQQVVRLLAETLLVDPPEDLEYRTLGELVFPSPGAAPVFQPPAPAPQPWSTRLFRRLRPWVPVGVAVVALLAAVIGYGVVRSSVDTLRPAAEDTRSLGAVTPESASEMSGQLAASPSTSVSDTSATLKTGAPGYTATVTAAGITDRKKMIKGLENAQGPAYVVFLAETAVTAGEQTTAGTLPPSPANAQPSNPAGAETTISSENAQGATTAATTGNNPVSETTPSAGATGSSTFPAGSTVPGSAVSGDQAVPAEQAVTAEQAAEVVAQLAQFSGLQPLEESLWLDGPTYAAYLPRIDAEELVDLVRSIGASVGLTVMLRNGPPEDASDVIARLMEARGRFPILEASRAPQPATWGFIFTTSTLGGGTAPQDSGQESRTATTLPDEGGKHILLIIYIQRGVH